MVDRKEVIQKALDSLVEIAKGYDSVESVETIYDKLVMEIKLKCDTLKADMSQNNGYSRKLADLQHQLHYGDPTIQKKVWREIKNLEEEMLFEQPTPVNLDLTNILREIDNLGSTKQESSSPHAPFSPPLNHPAQIPQHQPRISQSSYEPTLQQLVDQPPASLRHPSTTQPPVSYPPVNQHPTVPPSCSPSEKEDYRSRRASASSQKSNRQQRQHSTSSQDIQRQVSHEPPVQPTHQLPAVNHQTNVQPSYGPSEREDRSGRPSASPQMSNRHRDRHPNSSQDITITPRSDPSLPPSDPRSRPSSVNGTRQTTPQESQVLCTPDMFRTQTPIPAKNNTQSAIQNSRENHVQSAIQNSRENHVQSAVQNTSQYKDVPRDLLPHHLQPIENEPDRQDQIVVQLDANKVQHDTDQNRQLVSMSPTHKYTDMCKNKTIKRFFTVHTQYTNPNEWSKLEIAEFYNPHKFFVKTRGSSSGEDRAYDQISIKIIDHLSSAQSEHDIQKSYPDGTLVLAKFTIDNQWYRGVITRQHEDYWYDVLFIDFGNSQNSNYREIRLMPNFLQHFPMMAQQCFLAEVDKPQTYKDSVGTNEGWLQTDINMIWELLLGKKLEFRVLSEKKQIYGVVIMFEQDDGTKVNLNKKLIDMGLVMRDDSAYSRDAQVESVLDLCHSPTHFSPSTTFDEIPGTISNIVEPTPFDNNSGHRGRGSINHFSELRRPGFEPRY